MEYKIVLESLLFTVLCFLLMAGIAVLFSVPILAVGLGYFVGFAATFYLMKKPARHGYE